jgi:signal transduction histidine kinase
LTREYLLSDRITAGSPAGDSPVTGGIFEMLDQIRKEYRRLIGSLPIPYILLEQDGYGVRYCNDAFLSFLGLPPGTAAEEVTFMDLLDGEARERMLLSLRESGELRGEELRGCAPEGRRFVIVGSFRESANDGYIEGGFVDVTSHKRLQEELARSSKLETVGRLAAGLAHDFSNILLVVSGFADLISCEESASEQIRAYASQIRKSVTKAETMTRRLLSMRTPPRSQHSREDLHTALREAESSLRQHLRADQSLLLSLEAHDPLVDIPAEQIDQVVRNLVLNARDATPAGGTITISTRTGGSLSPSHPSPVLLEIRDTGIGMDAETRRRIFEPYFTTKVEGAGTGLGLSMVQLIIEGVGGSIEVESEPGKGTLFRIMLPSAVTTETHGG